ncbi:MAG: pilus assembly protein TadG-related protein [Pseudomonadota bacterium]
MMRIVKLYRRFVKEEDGSLLVFSVFVFLMFLAAAGMGVDYMRHELYRAELQNALDRGLLAATAFSQDEDPVVVVNEFIANSAKWNGVSGAPIVNVVRFPDDETWFDEGVAERTIAATAEVKFDTHFLHLMGIRDMGVQVASNATQSRKSVEVAIVLDISLSMDGNDSATGTSKYYGMQTAANDFIERILNAETEEATSITLVPFAGTVNAGDFQPYMNLDADNLPSWINEDLAGFPVCPEFDSADFDSGSVADIDFDSAMTIQPWFKMYGRFPGNTGMVRWGNCPESDGGIVAYSNNIEELQGAINTLPMYGGTGIDMAMKWALFALSPNARSIADELIEDGEVETEFEGWPRDFGDSGAEKYIVFLTDGEITNLSSLKDDMISGTVADLEERDGFASEDDKAAVIAHMTSAVGEDGLLADYWASPNDEFYLGIPNYSIDRKNIVRNSGNVTVDPAHATTYIKGAQLSRWSSAQALQHVENVCGFMKAQSENGGPNVRVFTIGFNIAGLDDPDFTAPASAAETTNDTRAAFVLDYCATYDDDRYLATSDTLSDAFSDIAAKINTLRLTN